MNTLAQAELAASPLGTFERYLSLWVLGAILAGIALGLLAPGMVGVMAGFEYASVNLVVALLIWAMIFPMMVGVDFSSIRTSAQAQGAGDNAGGQLADQALHHGRAGGAVLRLSLCRADVRSATQTSISPD
jgi:hypothetical protein